MKYKEFLKWCNERACDGLWGITCAMYCMAIMKHVNRFPFWKREKKWQEISETVEREIVSPVNQRIKEVQKKEEQ